MKSRRKPSGRLCTLTLLGIVAVSPAVAFAHGGPPAALGLLAANADGPEVILLNEGLALKRPEAWSYMCPSLWGEINQASGKYPLARSADGVETWVCGGQDLYLLRDQKLVGQMRPEFRRNEMIGLANDAEHVYGLHYTGSGPRMSAEVVRLRSDGGDTTFWQSDVYWSAITANADGIHVARVAAEKQLELATLDKSGKELSRGQAMLPLTPLEIQLHALGKRVYVTANDGTHSMFGFFEGTVWKEVLQDTMPIVGPQSSPDGTLWIAIGGALKKLQDETPEAVDEPRMITCLEQWNDWHYACVGSDLFHLTESGIGERVFAMDGFHAPDPKLVPPEAADNCAQQWVLYTVDAMRSGLTFVDWPHTDVVVGGMSNASAGASAPAPSNNAGAPAAGASGSRPVAGPAVVAGGAPGPESDGGCSVATIPARGRADWFGIVCAALGLFFSVRRAAAARRRLWPLRARA
jgi:hypothetical protein